MFDLENEACQKARENKIMMKRGPPVEQNRVEEVITDCDLSVDKNRWEKSKEAVQKGKAIPNVDIPPKATVWVPINQVSKDNQLSKLEPTYKTRAPVEIGVDIEKLVESVLDLEISVPLRSLAGVSGQIQKEIQKQVTKSRIPLEVEGTSAVALQSERQWVKLDKVPIATYIIMTDVSDKIPEGSFVADDPVLQYLSEHKDADPEDLVVAAVSELLRLIYMTIN